MLVLSRVKGERVIVGNDVTVEVVEIRGNKVRLGFTAPPTVSVDREEVWLAKQKSKHPSPGDQGAA